jgi:hypothetical protein
MVLGAWCVCVQLIKMFEARNAGARFNFGDDWIEMLARDHQNVTRHNCQLAKWLFLEHDGHRPELAFLSGGLAGADATGDHHRIICLEFDRRRPDFSILRRMLVLTGAVAADFSAGRGCSAALPTIPPTQSGTTVQRRTPHFLFAFSPNLHRFCRDHYETERLRIQELWNCSSRTNSMNPHCHESTEAVSRRQFM